MNLERHVAVIWRHRGIAFAGIVLGLAVAFLAAFSVSGSGVERRGGETWSSESSVLVTQRGFPWGRVTLPGQADVRGEKQAFGDPNRFSTLAMLYSVISYSDQVRGSLPERPAREQIQAAPLDATGNGAVYLPIVKLTTTAQTAEGARSLNQHAIDGLSNLLTSEQRHNSIPADQRIELNVLNAPSKPVLASGRSLTLPMLAFIMCLVAALAVAHLVESLRKPQDDALAEPVTDDDELRLERDPGLIAVEDAEPWTQPAVHR